jgi:hypothetical protein
MAAVPQSLPVLIAELGDITDRLCDLYADLAVVEYAETHSRAQTYANGLNQGAAVNATERLAEVQALDHRLEAIKVRADIRSAQERRDFLRLQIEQGFYQ